MHAPGQHSSKCADGSHLVESATIHTLAVLEDLLAHQGFGQSFEAVPQQLRACCHGLTHSIVLLEASDLLGDLCFHGIQRGVALLFALIKLLEHLADRFGAVFIEIGRNCFVFSGCFRLDLLDAQILQQLLLGLDQFTDRFVTEVDCFDDVPFRQLVGTGFHHHHTVGCSSDN